MGFWDWKAGWGKPRTEAEAGAFYEKAFRRAPLAAWDARWHRLSRDARAAFLDQVKGPARGGPNTVPQTVSAAKFDSPALAELVEAGFVTVEPSTKKNAPARVAAVPDVADFATRVRGLARYRPLDRDGPPDSLTRYVDWMTQQAGLLAASDEVLRAAGFDLDDFGYDGFGPASRGEFENHRWPGWVAQKLKMPEADRLLKAVEEAGGPVPSAEVADRVPGADPGRVRNALDLLVGHLALAEGLDPNTLDVVVDFLPGVREGLDRERRPKVRPPLATPERVKEVGPDSGLYVDDLRAVLLEVAAEPPMLRQDGELYAKEVPRFQAAIEPLPDWLAGTLGLSTERRLVRALNRAGALGMVAKEAGKVDRLVVSDKGGRWLSSDLDGQYREVFDAFRKPPGRHDRYGTLDGMVMPAEQAYSSYLYPYGKNDAQFLGSQVAVTRRKKGAKPSPYALVEPRDDDVKALREAAADAFLKLDPGAFVTLESVIAHHTYGPDNVVRLGRPAEEVVVVIGGRPVPPFEEEWEDAGRLLLEGLAFTRLIPLGALQAAVDDAGNLAVRPTRRLAAYFGRGELTGGGPAAAGSAESKVVVQPDFSVIVVGLNPAPVAELAPFCERVTRGSGAGAQTLKITRESVVRAVARGLAPAQIVERLERLASHNVPANVLHEVKEWGGWVRKVKAQTLSVLRCPDPVTADRVVAALKGKAERLSPTLVALDAPSLAKPERDRLQAHGLLLEGDWGKPSASSAPKKRRGWR